MRLLFAFALALIVPLMSSVCTFAETGDQALSAELYNLQVAGADAIEGDVTFVNNGPNALSIYVGDQAGNAPPVFHLTSSFSLLATNAAGQQYQLPVVDPLPGCFGRCGQVRILLLPGALYAIHVKWRRTFKVPLLPPGSYNAYVEYHEERSACAICWTGRIQSRTAPLTVQ
jgi:hypothetical protein